ncbi:orotidine-5'-phosphate decarboxylase [Bacillus sp. FSL W7-1360]
MNQLDRPFFLALDFATREERQQCLARFADMPLDVKVGMALFYQVGPTIISELKTSGHRIFLDLKLHDIPNTVGQTMKVLASLGVDVVNVHAAGGKKMMEAAREGLEAGTPAGQLRPKIIAVTQLTSTDEIMLEKELLLRDPLPSVVQSYAQLAQESGLDGVVCSAEEVPLIHEACGQSFLTVTPGIRRLVDEKGDQRRVVTPERARSLGSWAIVVGRSVTKAVDPLVVYQEMKRDWEGSRENE